MNITDIISEEFTDDFPYRMTPVNRYAEYFCGMLEYYLSEDECGCDDGFSQAEILLDEMGLNVDESLAYFETMGAFCDCEILPNVFGI